jgi:glycosyltransferase involved in cell wall biosynthesis
LRYLFLHQNFPGQFVHIVNHALRSRENEVVFLSEPNKSVIPGVRKVAYRTKLGSRQTHVPAQEFEAAILRAEAVAQAAHQVKALGFTPDIIIGHHGWGELLNIGDVWAGTPLLGYFEYFYQTAGADVGFDPEFPTPPADFARIRAKNAVNLLALALGGHGQTPTAWQRSTYPAWAQDAISLLPEGVNLEICHPDPTSRERHFALSDLHIDFGRPVLTYVSRDLEPYRGFHILMRALPQILRERRDLQAVLVGGDGASYGFKPPKGTWREVLLAELGTKLDRDRVHFVGRIPYPDYVRLLQRSDVHVYLSYPFVASWSLREALAMGCAIVGSDTTMVREFITHRRNGLLTPFHDPDKLADVVLTVLEDQALNARIRRGARRFAEKALSMADYLANYEALIRRLTGAPNG